MTRRRRKGQADLLNNTSFLDVMSNTVGALVFLLMLIVLVTIAVKLNYRPIEIETPRELPDAMVGEVYRVALAGVGGNEPYRWWIEERERRKLPRGLRFVEIEEPVVFDDGVTRTHVAGLLTGKPEEAGAASFEIWLDDTPVKNSEGEVVRDKSPSKKAFALSVRERPVAVLPLEIRTKELPKACVGHRYSVTLAATGGVAPYRWQLGDHHPEWVELQGDRLVGTPTAVGGGPVSFVVTDTRNGEEASGPVELQAGGCLGWCCPPPPNELTILTHALPEAMVNRGYDLTLAAVGGIAPYRWSLVRQSELPEGLTLSVQGRLTGRPARPVEEHEFWIAAENDPAAGVQAMSERRLVLSVLPEPAKVEPLRIF